MENFGKTADGTQVHRITLASDQLSVSLLTLGACLQQVRLAGLDRNLTLGFPSLEPYLSEVPSAGMIMGPVVNRIRDARVTIDGQAYALDQNFRGQHMIHGGHAGTHSKVWQVSDTTPSSASLSVSLPDREGGFPGMRQITASFRVESNQLTLTLTGATDQPTVMNLANHSYWNLGPAPTTKGHIFTAHADHCLPTTNEQDLLPTGEIASVQGTRFDYTQGRQIEAGAEGLLDNNLCLSPSRQALREIATLTAPDGTSMTMASTEPGLQIFDGHILGKATHQTTDGRTPQPYAALALEAQAWPDAPNHPSFPDITLRPGETYQQITSWTFNA